MNERRLNRSTLWLTFALAGLMVTSASADVVSNGSPSGPPGSGSKFEITLDLTGYQHAAVSFDFAALMSGNSKHFSLSSATDTQYRNGFRLLSPSSSLSIGSGSGPSSSSPGNSGHFQYNQGGLRYATAMFNLAAYDGQSVILSVENNNRAANRRGGIVNLENLKIAVNPLGVTLASAEIPEPTSIALLSAGLLGLFGSRRSKQRIGAGRT